MSSKNFSRADEIRETGRVTRTKGEGAGGKRLVRAHVYPCVSLAKWKKNPARATVNLMTRTLIKATVKEKGCAAIADIIYEEMAPSVK